MKTADDAVIADDAPTIFGRTPTWSAIVAGGGAIAIGLGALSLSVSAPLGWLFATPWVMPVILTLIAAAMLARLARWALHRAARPRDLVFLGVFVKLANMVAIALLGLAALVALAIGSAAWRELLVAVLLAFMLGATLSVLTSLAANLSAFRR